MGARIGVGRRSLCWMSGWRIETTMPRRFLIPLAIVIAVIAGLVAAVRGVEQDDSASPLVVASAGGGAGAAEQRSDGGVVEGSGSFPAAPGSVDERVPAERLEAEEEAGVADTPVLGQPIALGEVVLGTLGAEEVGLFQFEAEDGQLLQVSVDGRRGMDPVTVLLGPDGAVMAENDDESAVNRDSLIVVRTSRAGSYTVRVTAFDAASAGEFALLVDQLPDEPDEPLRRLAMGESLAGYLGTPDDADDYVLLLTVGERVGVVADGEVGVDTHVEVFGPEGNFVAADDDGGHGLDAAVSFEAETAGEYRVVVTGVSSKVGPYALRVSRVAVVAGFPEVGLLGLEQPALEAVDHGAGVAALGYWNALRLSDGESIYALAGPEARTLWGWESAGDLGRDLVKLRSIGTSGFAGTVMTVGSEERARVAITLVQGDGTSDGTLVVDVLAVAEEWRVESARREFPRSDSAYGGPLPVPTGPPPILLGTTSAPVVTAAAAVVIDAESGALLYAKDPHRPLAPASLTKIATAILAVEEGDLEAQIVVDVDSGKMVGSSLMRLRPGDRFTLRDLLYGLMLASGNDAALAIGRALSGNDAAFVADLNALVARIGLQDSTLKNAHGLDEAGHRISAFDLGMLARYGMTLPAFAEVVGTRDWTASGSRQIRLTNSNPLLGRDGGVDGVKTGYTTAARETVVVSAERDGHRVIVVLLKAPQRWAEAPALLDWAFANHCWTSDLSGACASLSNG